MSTETHWGPDPGHGGLTQHKGTRRDCSGPDCGSDDGSHFWQATQSLDASDWQRQEGHLDTAIQEAARAQAHATLAVANELRRSNESRDDFYREVVTTLRALREDEDPQHPPVSKASDTCAICHRYTGAELACDDVEVALTRNEWLAHCKAIFDSERSDGSNATRAHSFADETMRSVYGACPGVVSP